MKLQGNQSDLNSAQNEVPSVNQSSQETRLTHKKLNTLLKFLPDPVFAFTSDNTVEYLNPAFEKTFGWTLKEVKGKSINFVPDHLIDQAKDGIKRLYRDRVVHDFETQRYTKDGRILDILINGSILYNEYDKPIGQVLILRDMTVEKRMAKSNQIMFKISKALHHYHKLGDLIALITKEIQKLISVEGTFILLADKSKKQLYFLSAQYKNKESEKKFKKIKIPADQGVSGRVFQTGEPLLIPDISKCSFFLRRVDDETDLVTHNMLSVPIKLKDQNIGVISVVNKLHGKFDATDIDLLSMVTSTIALPIENTRVHEELRKSYQDLKILNQAKDNAINHLAHELKTPISVLSASMNLLSKRLTAMGIDNQQIEKTFTRGQRNLNRILDIQYEVDDLLRRKDYKAYNILNRLLEACKDELSVLVESETENSEIINRVNKSIETIFGPKEKQSKTLQLDKYLTKQIQQQKNLFMHRDCLLNSQIEKNISIHMPLEILDILINGIIQNAVEYTPDGGKINIILKKPQPYPELIIKDSGIGFTREKLHLISENFFSPPASSDYSTKKPFDFNAGGRGFDLLRMKIFSERYHFKIWIDSNRCNVIPNDDDICPGDIKKCNACSVLEDCYNSGETCVHIQFLNNNKEL